MSKPPEARDPAIIRGFYDREGYYVFRGLLSRAAIDDVDGYLTGEVYPLQTPLWRHPSLTFEPHAYQTGPDGNPVVCNALFNPHLEKVTAALGQLLLRLICTEEVADILEMMDGDHRHTLHQIILFFVQANTRPHIDGWGVDTATPGDVHTMWIPLEPITLHNGPVCVFPWQRGKRLAPQSLGLDGLDRVPIGEAQELYNDALCAHDDMRETGAVVPLLKPGDLLIFASTTPHATMPPRSEGRSRRALQIIVRPASARWGNAPLWRLRGEDTRGSDPNDIIVNERWKVSTLEMSAKTLQQKIRSVVADPKLAARFLRHRSANLLRAMARRRQG